MEGLEFDVDAARPRTSFDLKRFRSGRAECLHPEILLEKRRVGVYFKNEFIVFFNSKFGK